MPCYKPLEAWQQIGGQVTFHRPKDYTRELTLPCRQCIGCRLERSRQWAVRCMHEANMHEHNAFVTLTYNDEHNPGNLIHRDIQLFLKRLRKSLCKKRRLYLASPDQNHKTIKYYMAGEYGTKYRRPHYHLCIFGLDFADKKYLAKSPAGEKLYRSDNLEKLWDKGFSSIGEVTFESAAYTARYVMKKITGQKAEKHYEVIDIETGEIKALKPEYNRMSTGRKQGEAIGAAWLKKYTADVYPQRQVIVRGRKTKPPRYYDKLWAKQQPLEHEWQQHITYLEVLHNRHDNTPERLAVKEQVAAAQINQLKRKL